jgi:hypothetical protein
LKTDSAKTFFHFFAKVLRKEAEKKNLNMIIKLFIYVLGLPLFIAFSV